MISDETFNTGRFIEFPQTLIKGIGRKIFLIVDNLWLHHTKPVKAWLGRHGTGRESIYRATVQDSILMDGSMQASSATGPKIAARAQAKL